jgi:FkbM family methyltransferase
MTNFKSILEEKLLKSHKNNYDVDIYDYSRIGEYPIISTPRENSFVRIKRLIKIITGYEKTKILQSQNEFLKKYGDRLQLVYGLINGAGKELLVELIAYRLLGYRKIKLAIDNKEYWDKIEIANSLIDWNDTYNPHFLHFILKKCYLSRIGFNIQLYFTGIGIATDFIIEQYAYKSGGKTIVAVEEGDVVLDLGACWGDTALYFACKTGKNGKVYSFEFIPGNIKLFNMNISLNPVMINQIELIQQPVSNISGDKIYFNDNGPASRIEFESNSGQTGFATTISIDDFIETRNIEKVDFIKMDIEGGESLALEGAIETIKKFKPKLAIAIYHSMEDFADIPRWIANLDLGYKFYLGHYSIHEEETVIFAICEK